MENIENEWILELHKYGSNASIYRNTITQIFKYRPSGYAIIDSSKVQKIIHQFQLDNICLK